MEHWVKMGQTSLSHSYQNICNLVGGRQYLPYQGKERNITILHCSANMRKKIKMADSQSPPEDQLKRHALI